MTRHDCGGGWRSYFAYPRGPFGWFAGWLMALKNKSMYEAAVRKLDLAPTHSVLEVGFGHGAAIAAVARKTRNGLVAGVDPSPVMLRQAHHRNRRSVRLGRVELREGTAARIPFEDETFDRIFAVNSFQFWGDPEVALKEVSRVLKPGGRLLVALRMRDKKPGRFSPPGFARGEVEDIRADVGWAGFENVELLVESVGRDVTFLTANKR